MKRRAVLSAVLGTSIAIGGCPSTPEDREGEGTTVEIIPSNLTQRQISLRVEVYARDGSLLLDRAYSLQAGHADESEGVENRVGHLLVSLDGGEKVRHEYAPDIDICSKDGEDIQIIVESDGIELTYSC